MQSRIFAALRLAGAVAALWSTPSFAQDSSASDLPDEVQSYLGDWELQQEDASAPTCALTFGAEAVPGGWAVSLPNACPAPFPPASALAAWNIDAGDDSILLLDGSGHVTMKLLADPDGYYATTEDVTPRFYLVAPVDEDGTGGEQDAD